MPTLDSPHTRPHPSRTHCINIVVVMELDLTISFGFPSIITLSSYGQTDLTTSTVQIDPCILYIPYLIEIKLPMSWNCTNPSVKKAEAADDTPPNPLSY